MKKVVVKLDIHDDKEKKKALKAVSSLSGIQSISIDMKDRKLTIIGEIDPIAVVNKLRKLWHAELVSVGPDKEPEKKKDDDKKKEEEKKKEDEKKKDDAKKKDEEKKREQNEQIQDLIKAYQNYNPYVMRQYVVHSAEEDPNSCVIS